LRGILVFGELAGADRATYARVVGGSLVMALGAAAIALSPAPGAEHRHWQEAAAREASRYGVDPSYVGARLSGDDPAARRGRTAWDWLIVAGATAVFVAVATGARAPELAFDHRWAAGLVGALLALLGLGGVALWRATRFA
jgi:hypothetical protein